MRSWSRLTAKYAQYKQLSSIPLTLIYEDSSQPPKKTFLYSSYAKTALLTAEVLDPLLRQNLIDIDPRLNAFLVWVRTKMFMLD